MDQSMQLFGAAGMFRQMDAFARENLLREMSSEVLRQGGEHFSCCCNVPYPPVAVSYPCSLNGKQILKLYAGDASELSCIMKYLYFGLSFKDACPEVSSLFLCASECEMRHLHILGELAVDLGMDPRYWTIDRQNRSRYWCADPAHVGYTQDLGMALLGSIEGEKRTIANYQKAMQAIDDDKVNLMLRRIIMDEDRHIELFSEAFQRFVR